MNVGILGGGQLARMLALAGYPLGLKLVVLDPSSDACAAPVATLVLGAFDDQASLEQFAGLVDMATYEFENVPVESVRYLAGKLPVFPSPDALVASRDRLIEKGLFRELGIPTPAFLAVDNLENLKQAVSEIGLPSVLKSRTLGYDGKGQAVLYRSDDVLAAWELLGGVPCILESFVPFSREISVIAARGRSGETVFYPVSENTHRSGILHVSVCKPLDPMQKTAEEYSRRLFDRLDYVGVLALEFFDVGGALLANELAPRVHNTGHWTIEGAWTSQFENHLRAILNLPLGDASACGNCAMVNFVGHIPEAAAVLAIPGAHFHDYGKQLRAGRKLGHATVCADSEQVMLARLKRILALVA